MGRFVEQLALDFISTFESVNKKVWIEWSFSFDESRVLLLLWVLTIKDDDLLFFLHTRRKRKRRKILAP
jgi:hypothetical protein